MSGCFNLLLCRHNKRLGSLPLLVKLVEVDASFCKEKASSTVVASLVILHRYGAVLPSLNGDEELQGRLQRDAYVNIDTVVWSTTCSIMRTIVFLRDLAQIDSERYNVVDSLSIISYEHSDHLLIYLVFGVTWRLIVITSHKPEG
jgi:hypothetical protein